MNLCDKGPVKDPRAMELIHWIPFPCLLFRSLDMEPWDTDWHTNNTSRDSGNKMNAFCRRYLVDDWRMLLIFRIRGGCLVLENKSRVVTAFDV